MHPAEEKTRISLYLFCRNSQHIFKAPAKEREVEASVRQQFELIDGTRDLVG